MRVSDAQSRDVRYCSPDTSLSTAGWMLWEYDCGILPVVDEQRRVVGVITDRDICMSAVTKLRPMSEIRVHEVITGRAYCCKPGDDVRDALKTMRTNQVRRLPVVEDGNKLVGVLSVTDLILRAREPKGGKPSELSYEDVMLALKAISAPWQPAKESGEVPRLEAAAK